MTSDGGIEEFEATYRPDLHAARTWLRMMRRIDRVTISVRKGGAAAHLDGVANRLPVRRSIHVDAALGLQRLRIPTFVEGR